MGSSKSKSQKSEAPKKTNSDRRIVPQNKFLEEEIADNKIVSVLGNYQLLFQ